MSVSLQGTFTSFKSEQPHTNEEEEKSVYMLKATLYYVINLTNLRNFQLYTII